MTKVQRILVGIDLSRGDRLVASEITESNRHAVEKAIWLAVLTGAKLTFFTALELSAHTRHLIEEDEHNFSDVDDAALAALDEFAQQAQQQGVKTDTSLAYGTAWHEVISTVLKDNYDVVIVGTQERSGLERMLVGSTAMKLLRYCPCPVWVTKPDAETDTTKMLVATDLSPVGERAVKVAAMTAKAENAPLHVLHAMEYPLERPLRLSQASPEKIKEYREEVRQQAEKTLAQHLACEEVTALAAPPQIEYTDAAAETAIFDAIKAHNIDLLVMGTIARGGIGGLLVGNTAERILPQLPCSVLAVKPDDFVCPVKPE